MSEGLSVDTIGTRVAPRHRWQLRRVDPDRAERLRQQLGLSAVAAGVLAGRGFRDPASAEAFLQPSLAGLHDPLLFAGMDVAVKRLRQALRRREHIVVHGDYDVDGITATVLLVTVLRHLGADARFVLPHRIGDGYGLNPGGVDKARALGADVLICVDCGITATDACQRAHDHGIDVVIVDHHLPGAQLPDVTAIINPRLEHCGYPEENLAAVGLAFKLARALLRGTGDRASGLSMLRLVALGTVADLVPLVGENRLMTVHGLAGLAHTEKPGLLELMRVAGVDPRGVSAGDVGFRLAPRINAAGRIGDPCDAAELLLTDDPQQARRLAGHLQELNTRRQEMERQVFAEALEVANRSDSAITVVWGEGWHRGVIGIVASRLVEVFGRPALVVAIDGDVAYGSARSVPGFDIVAALRQAAGLLSRHGGHRQAAGFQLAAADLPEFRETLVAVLGDADSASLRGPLLCDARLETRQIDVPLALELERLAPFGIGNPRPRFLCEGARLAAPPRLLKNQHLKLLLRSDDGDVEAVAWRRPDLAGPLAQLQELSLVATIKPRRWSGRLQAQLEIEDVCA